MVYQEETGWVPVHRSVVVVVVCLRLRVCYRICLSLSFYLFRAFSLSLSHIRAEERCVCVCVKSGRSETRAETARDRMKSTVREEKGAHVSLSHSLSLCCCWDCETARFRPLMLTQRCCCSSSDRDRNTSRCTGEREIDREKERGCRLRYGRTSGCLFSPSLSLPSIARSFLTHRLFRSRRPAACVSPAERRNNSQGREGGRERDKRRRQFSEGETGCQEERVSD